MAPNLAFADPRQGILRVFRFELPRQAVAIENAIGDQARRMAIANLIDRLNFLSGPLRVPLLELAKQAVIAVSRGT